jgi:phosphatidylglycerophosphate synthase
MKSIKELRDVCQPKPKSSVNTDTYGYRILRLISIYITWILLHTNITANQVTAIGIVFGWIGIFLISIPTYSTIFIGFALIYLYVVSDACDGEIAWYRKKPTQAGVYLDQIGHLTTLPFIFVALGFNLFKTTYDLNILILCFFTTIIILLLQINSKLPRLIDSSEREKLFFPDVANKKKFSILVILRKIHKTLTYNLYIVVYIFLIFLITYILSKQGINLNIIPYVIIFYSVLLTITLITQIIIYFQMMKNKPHYIR